MSNSGGLLAQLSAPLPVAIGGGSAANLVQALQTTTVTTVPTTLVTVPAGRTFAGWVGAGGMVVNSAAATGTGRADVILAVAGVGVTPAAGNILVVRAAAGAGAAGGTVGEQGQNYGSLPVTVIAPVGNAVTITFATTNAGSLSITDAFAYGVLL